MEGTVINLVGLPEVEWNLLKASQAEILTLLQEVRACLNSQPHAPAVPISYITAKEFMTAVRIKRTKFDQLVQTSRVRIIKKDRKIYVPTTEVERYFANS